MNIYISCTPWYRF